MTLNIGPKEYPTNVRKNQRGLIENLIFINIYWNDAVIKPIINAGSIIGVTMDQISLQA
jgi:hypothetical protein